MSSASYPSDLAATWMGPDGTRVAIRPIRPEDTDIERAFVKALTPETRYRRFMTTLNELSPAMLAHFTQVDYARDMALIAVVDENGRETQVAVARYVLAPDGESCEFAIVVAEPWQKRGLGRYLMEHLIEIARARGVKRMTGEILPANAEMLDMAHRLGFAAEDAPGTPGVRRVSLEL